MGAPETVAMDGQRPRDWDREVFVAIKVFSLLNCDIIAQTFQAEFRIVLDWHEPALAEDGAEAGAGKSRKVSVAEWEGSERTRGLFVPRPLVRNGTRDVQQTAGRLDVWPDGRVSQAWDFRGAMMHEFDLRPFPFDDQVLKVVLRLKQTRAGLYVEPRPSTTRTSMIDQVLLPEWEVSPVIKAFTVASDPAKSTSGLSYNELVLTLHCTRVSESYLWNIGLLIFLLQSLSFACFALDPRDIADRVSLGLTLVLSAVALRFIVAEQLPKSAHLTALERYMNLAFGFIYGVTIEAFALPWYFEGEDNDDDLERWDNRLAAASGVFFVVQHVAAFALIAQQKRRLRRRFSRGAKLTQSWRPGTGPAA